MILIFDLQTSFSDKEEWSFHLCLMPTVLAFAGSRLKPISTSTAPLSFRVLHFPSGMVKERVLLHR